MSLSTNDFAFDLPPEQIAAHPAAERTGSRLLVLDRAKESLVHASFADLPQFLAPEDLLVLNNSRVLPAALDAETDAGPLTLLLVEETSPRHWLTLVKPAKRAMPGMRLRFRSRVGPPQEVEAEVLKTLESGERVLRFFGDIDLDAFGQMPIPPYIAKRRKALAETEAAAEDWDRYQTVYANPAAAGSVAAPTAGLHFTPELLGRFDHAFVTLHVGIGTFRPVKVDRVEDHIMHRERFEIPAGLAEKAAGRRIVAVGTTSARVLESAPSLKPQHGSTDIFIHPPYQFKKVGALLTNFHLPKSTLLMLVCAFAGQERTLAAYKEAVEKGYRFFSYGDAMLIL
ncbi:MAG: tRNA preQ1(34) S-adenosylmethionine ribosyltransferase-isomerase QueA [Verrucomicrobium sp.]|nr:tRNA preQ1(34) S-adenosylmethionine ribosyltransferase-isomerase QueA [Verrucomicrobium sp.]